MSLLGELNELNQKIKSKYPKNHNISYYDLRNSMIAFNVYYKSLQFTSITEMPKTPLIGLIANIGGLLGLFIGVSFLSFGEVIEIICEIVFIVLKKNKKTEKCITI
jgi:hypothetical protein